VRSRQALTQDERIMRVLIDADEAERRGDAARALEHLMSVPVGADGQLWWRPWRIHYLSQFARLEPDLPRWAYSRWILAQALQSLDEGFRPQLVSALRTAVDVRGGPLLGHDVIDAQVRVVDHDWVYRQLVLYELGGLDRFVRTRASGDLLVGADEMSSWGRTPIGAYRLVERLPAHVTWERLRDGASIRTPNTGAAAMVWTDAAVLGRLMPTQDTSLFESAPLAVPDHVAERVAAEPTEWIDALRQWDGYQDAVPLTHPTEHDGLLVDLPRIVWQNAVCDQPDTSVLRPVTADALARSALELGRFLLEEFVAPNFCHLDIWACLAAALVDPDVVAALARWSSDRDRQLLAHLGEALAEPAASVCRRLAAGESPRAA
jgi:hypothetical protein